MSDSIIAPRLLSLRDTAALWGVCPNSFRKLMRLGVAPGPLYIPELDRNLFDKEQQDQAIRALRREKAVA